MGNGGIYLSLFFSLHIVNKGSADRKWLDEKGSKSPIVNMLIGKVEKLPHQVSVPQSSVSYIIVGGHLLDHVAGQCPASLQSVCKQYVAYVLCHYGK